MGPGTPAADHLARGGIVACVESDESEEHLVILDGARRLPLATVREVPLSFGGAARFQLENILAASAAAYVQGVPTDRIREGLLSFVPSVTRTPGRLNMLETDLGRVILDYAHNAAAIVGLLDFVARMPAEQRIAVIGVPGDRRDEALRDVGKLAAKMDFVIFKEHHHYRRGRVPGEGAALLAEGLLSTGYPRERMAEFNEERDAVEHAISLMRPGSIAVIIADSPTVLNQLDAYVVRTEPSADETSV
jgi:cyanophycin synthetase